MKKLKDSLCWHCSRATDGSCSWSKDFTPVSGWVARRSITKWHYGAETFLVKECPQFARYENTTAEDGGIERLADAVFAAAGSDYLDDCTEAAELMRDLPRLKTCITLYHNKYRYLYGRVRVKIERYYELKPRLKAQERFFKSETAMMFCKGDPVYIMETIQRHTGISSEKM